MPVTTVSTSGATALNDQLWGSVGHRSRSHEAETCRKIAFWRDI